MLKNSLSVLTLFIASSAAIASGVHTITRDAIINNKHNERSIERLSDDAHYLGSTAAWHLFASRLTSYEGGRPFDNTHGYKIAVG